MDLGQIIVIGLSALLLVWYVGAGTFNRRRGVVTYRWLRRGLETIGEITESRWLGTSGTGGRFVIARAKKPFRRLEAFYLLETRELLPYWLVSHLRGRRDELIIKASLRVAPNVEVEAGRDHHPEIIKLISEDHERPYEPVPAPDGFTIARRGPADDRSEKGLIDFLTEVGVSVQRVSLKRDIPHLEMRLRITPLMDTDPERFFSMLQAWFQK